MEKTTQIQFNSADSNIIIEGKKLNPIYRKEWNPYRDTQLRGESYKDFGIFYGNKYLSDFEKDEIIAKEKDKSDKEVQSWGRNHKYDNYFKFTKISTPNN